MLSLILARGLVFGIPLAWSRWLFGKESQPGHYDRADAPADAPVLKRAGAVVGRMDDVADHLPWHSTCLVRAFAGQLLLRRRGIHGGVVRFGVRRQNGRLDAHAWLVLHSVILSGGKEADNFQPLADLGGQP